MKRLVKRISLVLLLLAGLALIAPRTAEASKWRRYAPRPYVYQHYYVAPAVVYAPPVRVYAPPVRVYAPAVGVSVGPGVYVRAPGVRVNVGVPYSSYYRGPYYYRW